MRHILTFFLRMLVNGLSKDLGNLIEMFIIIRERILIILLKWSKIRITALEEVLSTMHSQSTAGCPFLIYTCRMQWRKNFRKNLLCMQKRQYLSKGKKLNLIKSTLSSLLIYLMSLYINPRKASLRLDKIPRDFLRVCALEKKLRLVNWLIVCMDKKNEGLGIRRGANSLGSGCLQGSLGKKRRDDASRE